MKFTSTRSFAMNDRAWKALTYLKKRKVNLSTIIQNALIVEARKEKELEEKYPDNF